MGILRTWAPSVVLTILVGLVFFVLRGFGPESTLQKFHVAAANGDFKTLQNLSTADSPQRALIKIQNQVLGFAQRGYRYEVRSIQPQKGYVIAVVNYVHPAGQAVIPMPFVLVKQSAQWVVNPQASLSLLSQVSAAPGTSF